MESTCDTTEALRLVKESAQESSNDVRVYAEHRVSEEFIDEIRQGDVYLYAAEEPTPSSLRRRSRTEDMQLAEGTTRGSRHVLADEALVRVFAPTSGDPLEGPLVEVRERVLLTHPEHADISLAPGWYQVRFQLDVAAEERARVAD